MAQKKSDWEIVSEKKSERREIARTKIPKHCNFFPGGFLYIFKFN